MADSFNPYVEWLGLPSHLVTPNHYQLLGLEEFESDPARIATAADRATTKVRSFRPGPNARAWSKLLDELLLAKGSLLDSERKAEYDAELREQPTAPAATGNKTDSTAGHDPRFPPGMGPNEGRAAEKPAESRPAAATEPRSTEPMTAVPAATSAPAPFAAPTTPPAPVPFAAPMAQPVPPTAWPASMLHPVAHGPAHGPTQPGVPQGGQPQPMYGGHPFGYPQPANYPMAQPAYGVPGYGQPNYSPPNYAGPNYAQPNYAPPAQYGMPGYAMPYAAPGAGQPPTMYGHSGYSPYGPAEPPAPTVAHPPMPVDPMAPVALPPTLTGGSDDAKQPRVLGFAAAATAAPAAIPSGSIPKGKAVTPTRGNETKETPSVEAKASQAGPSINTGPGSIPRGDLATYSPPSSSEKLVLYGTISAVILLVGAIIFAIASSNKGGDQVANNPAPPAPAPKALPRFEPTSTKPSNSPKTSPTTTKPEPKPVRPEPVNPKPTPEPLPAEPVMPVKPVVEPVVPKVPEPAQPEPPATEPAKPEPAKPEPPKPEPPKPPEPMPEVKLTPVELATLSKSMTTAREALSERNFEEFEKQYAVAEQLARSQDQKDKVARLMVLGSYVKQFDRQLKSLLADENFDAGAELKIGKSTVVNVVERSPTTIVIRVAGVNKSYNVASLPDGLAMALIDKRLDPNDPVRHLVKGAYLAAAKVQTDEIKEKAKELFEQATREGADAGDLALVLTDSYEFKD